MGEHENLIYYFAKLPLWRLDLMLLSLTEREQRVRVRQIARKHWIATGGDLNRAKELTDDEIHAEYKSLIVTLTVVVLLTQLAYTLFRFWQDTHQAIPPEEPTAAEPGSLVDHRRAG